MTPQVIFEERHKIQTKTLPSILDEMEGNIRLAAEAARRAEEAARASKEAAGAATMASEEARRAGETAAQEATKQARDALAEAARMAREAAVEAEGVAKEAAAEAVRKTGEMAARMEKAHQDMVAQGGRFTSEAQEALRLANEALEKIKGIAGGLLTRWQLVVIILSITIASAIFGACMALLS